MQFGVFDHVDRPNPAMPLRQFYEERIQLTQAYERFGFYGYHIAEHHFTPLGMAASPGIFLASVAQRTKTLRFGPLVYLSDVRKYTVALGLTTFVDSTGQSNWNGVFAMSCLALVPVFLLFVFFQRYLIDGMATSGLKG